MKKFLAVLFTLVFALNLAACSGDDPLGGNSDQPGGGSSDGVAQMPQVQPSYAFNPYGTWVWAGNEKFTMTLNQDGTAVFTDNAENSYIKLYPRLQSLWLSTENTFTYDEANSKIKVTLHVDDRTVNYEYKVTIGNGFYILDTGEGGYDFVRAEDYAQTHNYFVNGPIRELWAGKEITKLGETVDMYPENEIKMTFDKVEMNSNYDVKFYFTLSAKTGISSFDWIYWTLYTKGEGGQRSDRVYFYDMNDQPVDSIADGQTLQLYFTIDSVDMEQSLTWFGCIKAGIFISGMYNDLGCRIVLPEQPT